MLQNKRLFTGLVVAVCAVFCIALLLFITRPTGVTSEAYIPSSPNLQTLPPQTKTPSEYSAIVRNLPITVTYTETRIIEESIGYLADPTKKGNVIQASYREGSQRTESSGTTRYLVDVPKAKKTFAVSDGDIVRCAQANEQLQTGWACNEGSGDEGTFE